MGICMVREGDLILMGSESVMNGIDVSGAYLIVFPIFHAAHAHFPRKNS